MNRGPYECTTQRSLKWQEGGRSLVAKVRADRQHSDIARRAPRSDFNGWSYCPGCNQSCTGAYRNRPGCHRCGIVTT